jgi:hypothetical protein
MGRGPSGGGRDGVQKVKGVWGHLNHNNNTLKACTRYLRYPSATLVSGGTQVPVLRPSNEFTADPPYPVIYLAGRGIHDST